MSYMSQTSDRTVTSLVAVTKHQLVAKEEEDVDRPYHYQAVLSSHSLVPMSPAPSNGQNWHPNNPKPQPVIVTLRFAEQRNAENAAPSSTAPQRQALARTPARATPVLHHKNRPFVSSCDHAPFLICIHPDPAETRGGEAWPDESFTLLDCPIMIAQGR